MDKQHSNVFYKDEGERLFASVSVLINGIVLRLLYASMPLFTLFADSAENIGSALHCPSLKVSER